MNLTNILNSCTVLYIFVYVVSNNDANSKLTQQLYGLHVNHRITYWVFFKPALTVFEEIILNGLI